MIRKTGAEPVEIRVIGDVDVIWVARRPGQKRCRIEWFRIRHNVGVLVGSIRGCELIEREPIARSIDRDRAIEYWSAVHRIGIEPFGDERIDEEAAEADPAKN